MVMQLTLQRLRGEFMEMPGLRLTVQQVQRLCGIEAAICKTMLDELVDAEFLCVKPDGRYSRAADDGEWRRAPARGVDPE
jgi:hypothetical protein